MLAYLKCHFHLFCRVTIILVHETWRHFEIDCDVGELRLGWLLLRLGNLWRDAHLRLDLLLWWHSHHLVVVHHILWWLLELLIYSWRIILNIIVILWIKNHLHVLKLLHVCKILHVNRSVWIHILSHLRILHHHSLELCHVLTHTWHRHHVWKRWLHVWSSHALSPTLSFWSQILLAMCIWTLVSIFAIASSFKVST